MDILAALLMLLVPIGASDRNVSAMHGWEIAGCTYAATDLGFRLAADEWDPMVPVLGLAGCAVYRFGFQAGDPQAPKKFALDGMGIGCRVAVDIKF